MKMFEGHLAGSVGELGIQSQGHEFKPYIEPAFKKEEGGDEGGSIMKYCEDYQNVTQKHQMSKCC